MSGESPESASSSPADKPAGEPVPPGATPEKAHAAATEAKPGAKPPIKRAAKLPQEWMNAPTQRAANRLVWILVLVATCLAIGLGGLIILLMFPSQSVGPVVLGQEFKDQEDNFVISPPINWGLEDRVPGTSIVIKGPAEKGYPPLIMVALEINPGRLNTFIEDHKYKIEKQDPTVKWLTEDDDVIDGCQSKRLEYAFEMPSQDNKGTVKVRAIQYVLFDRPRFYKITCCVAEHAYEKYAAKFEASARSFQRTQIKSGPPKIITEP